MVVTGPGHGENCHAQQRVATKDSFKVSRIQMKFATAEEYQIALDHVRQLGLYMTESASSTPRPQTSAATFPPSNLPPVGPQPGSAFTATPFPPTQLRDTAARPASAIPRKSELLSFPRPDSASSMHGLLSELPTIHENPLTVTTSPDSATFCRPSSSELPPRRELPFPRPDTPKSGGSDATKSGSRPSSSLMGPPPLPPSRDGRQRPTSRAGSGCTELPPLPKPTPVSQIQNPFHSPANTSERPTSRGGGGAPRPQSAKPLGKENQTYTSSTSTFRPTTSDGISSARNPFGAVNDVAQNAQVSESCVGRTPTSSDYSYQNYPHMEDLESAEGSLAEVEVYAKQSDDVRVDVLNRFLLKHLEDDGFLKLVEDVEMAWARIAPNHR